MRAFYLATAILCCNWGYAQHFTERYKVVTPDSLTNSRSEWVDFDNDGLLDLAIFATSTANRHYMMIVSGDTSQTPSLSPVVVPILNTGNVKMVDYNQDNQLDIISSLDQPVAKSEVHINNGNFSFAAANVNLPYFTVIHFADLNNDATEECILSGTYNGDSYTNIYQRSGTDWTLKSDSLEMALSSIHTIDLDDNGELDLAISGTDDNGMVRTKLLVNKREFWFDAFQEFPFTGTLAKADLNGDGWFDFVLDGSDGTGNPVNKILLRQAEQYTITDLTPMLVTYDLFLADFNSDGVVDVSRFGKTSTVDSLNQISFADAPVDILPHKNVLCQRFGDLDHDGDLDLAQTLAHEIVVLNNNAAKNNAPTKVSGNVTVVVFNRMLLYWNKSSDDHTNVSAVTYDVLLDAGASKQTADFDLANARRLRTNEGNNKSRNFKLFRNLDAATWQYAIQSVDNSFHGANDLCVGTGSLGQCANVDNMTIRSCSGEQIALTGPADALWFSFANGFLGIGPEQKFNSIKGDTVFYFTPAMPQCASVKTFLLEIDNNLDRTVVSDRYACTDSMIPFTAEGEWKIVSWNSDKLGNLGSTPTISFNVTTADTVTATMTNDDGCRLIRKTAIKISKPEITVQPDKVKLLKGESIQFHADGADEYVWSPATFLNEIHRADPTSTPQETIEYHVMGRDSVGCTASESVIVFVEETAFLPTLFTPNDDGKNDVLKIYGLNSATHFSFTIVDREGKQVYRSSNVLEVTSTGWNGKTKGADQPNGVYFWTVKGQNGGTRLLLNGKESGSLILMR
jgi:gliding motility-associated-like protein